MPWPSTTGCRSGSTIRFHRRDADTADRELSQLLEGRQADAALVFTCNGRGTRLFDDAHHDARAVARLGRTGTAWAASSPAGSSDPVGGHNFVHQFSASMALFRSR